MCSKGSGCMLYADDARIESAKALAEILAVIPIFEAARTTVSQRKTDDAATNTEPNNPRPTARDGGSRSELYAASFTKLLISNTLIDGSVSCRHGPNGLVVKTIRQPPRSDRQSGPLCRPHVDNGSSRRLSTTCPLYFEFQYPLRGQSRFSPSSMDTELGLGRSFQPSPSGLPPLPSV